MITYKTVLLKYMIKDKIELMLKVLWADRGYEGYNLRGQNRHSDRAYLLDGYDNLISINYQLTHSPSRTKVVSGASWVWMKTRDTITYFIEEYEKLPAVKKAVLTIAVLL